MTSANRVVELNRLGSISLLDLKIISEFYGRAFMPYPFMQTLPDHFDDLDEYNAYATSVPDRYNHGDLHEFHRWFSTYLEADLRVECSVQEIGSDSAGLRMLAHRCGEDGFLAIQKPDDSAEVLTLSPYDLGAAIAGSVELTGPGTHREIVIPEYARPAVGGPDDMVSVQQQHSTQMSKTVPRADVVVFARVQSHWQHTREWGFDSTRSAVVWVRIRDDGEYMYVPDLTCAKPMGAQHLSERIDRLIAKDVQILRELRNR